MVTGKLNRFFLFLLMHVSIIFCSFAMTAEEDNNIPMKKVCISGHKKAQSLSMEIKVPISWSVTEGDRPHIVKRIIAPKGNHGLLIHVRNLGQVVSKPEAENFFDETTLKELLPKNAVFQKCWKTRLETLPVWLLMYTMMGERLGIQIVQMRLDCFLVYDKYLISLQTFFIVQPDELKKPHLEAAAQEYQKALKQFMMILNSFVIHNVYN